MGTIRDRLEQLEAHNLSKYAAKSYETKGRKEPVVNCDIRTEFQRDRDRIIHSKSFRRLKHKTQVFLSPYDDHFRTRLTHTLEVSQIARTISRALALNEDLTEAVALGHDLGHTPFGHCGEGVLNHLYKCGFRHNEQSVRVVEVLENLNLCQETIDGIYTHSWGLEPKTCEAQVVQLADKIAYINHDIDDSIRAGIISEEDLPIECQEYFSSNQRERLSKMINDIILTSIDSPNIKMSDECWHYTTLLREWMFKNVYVDSPAKLEEKKSARIVCELYNYYKDFLSNQIETDDVERVVVDYISGMTDQYAIEKFKELFIPKPIQALNKDDAIFRLLKKYN